MSDSKFVFRFIFYFYQMESFACFRLSCFLCSALVCKKVWKTTLLALWTISWVKVLVPWMSSATELVIHHGEFTRQFFRRLLCVNGTNWFIGCLVRFNRPFLSFLVPLFQSESKCETILTKMTLICMKMKLYAELIFIWKVWHLNSFWNRGRRELGNGLFASVGFEWVQMTWLFRLQFPRLALHLSGVILFLRNLVFQKRSDRGFGVSDPLSAPNS